MSYGTLLSVMNQFFSDTKRSSAETLDGLKRLQEELDIMIDALENDVQSDE